RAATATPHQNHQLATPSVTARTLVARHTHLVCDPATSLICDPGHVPHPRPRPPPRDEGGLFCSGAGPRLSRVFWRARLSLVFWAPLGFGGVGVCGVFLFGGAVAFEDGGGALDAFVQVGAEQGEAARVLVDQFALQRRVGRVPAGHQPRRPLAGGVGDGGPLLVVADRGFLQVPAGVADRG